MKTQFAVSFQPNDGGGWTYLAVIVDGLVPLCGEHPRVMAGGISWQVQRVSFEPAVMTLYVELHPMQSDFYVCEERINALRAEGWK